MKPTSTAPFQSPSGDFDPALLLLNLRNKDDGESSDELRRASSQASSGPVSHAATVRHYLKVSVTFCILLRLFASKCLLSWYYRKMMTWWAHPSHGSRPLHRPTLARAKSRVV